MLVLSRKIGEQITIGDNITITVVDVQGQRIKLGIQAPDSYRILRAELPADETPKRSRPAQKKPVRDRGLMEMAAERRRLAPGGSSDCLGPAVTGKAKVYADCAK